MGWREPVFEHAEGVARFPPLEGIVALRGAVLALGGGVASGVAVSGECGAGVEDEGRFNPFAVVEGVRFPRSFVAEDVALFVPLDGATDLRGASVRPRRGEGSGAAVGSSDGGVAAAGAGEVPAGASGAEGALVQASECCGSGGARRTSGTTMRGGMASASPSTVGRAKMV